MTPSFPGKGLLMARALAVSCIILAALLTTPSVAAAKVPDTWDSLFKVKSKKLEAVYLLPNADFRPYTKVMLAPTEVAFRKNWQRNFNSSAVGLGGRISDSDASKIADQARTGFEAIFAKAYSDAGYQVVTSPGPDVLRLNTGVLNLSIDAPDVGASALRTYSAEAGEATVVIEVRDSLTNAVLGRAVDQRTAGDMPWARTRASNRADFEALFKQWADASVQGLNELKAMSPIDAEGQPGKP